jgi:hypothetical protein
MIQPTEVRCADALEAGCPDRRRCLRWADRLVNVTSETVFLRLAKDRGPTGCDLIIKMESSDAL